ncbi:GspH/FimT family pseudopilin [Luteimonas sp. MC1825]|uniref:GspH/FimT family pseudopilin n=1 Tax=Luteimonas sp. MC1825 TaxID=2761107 RepID=UPI00161499A9|nr:GspH/FimT family pseudopilin [Luteimonas sp. MC1825]MBB6598676.1 GspH/FimT family pseudopilin [Luteimonas sp. MC1825]QOC88849.1 GspH/FimT family pseudopilin [Luteimonas sp. MC1825]
MHHRRESGFTLIELMVTIAIVAILLVIGLPSFQGSLRSNRVATSTNELMASVSLARTEAIRSTKTATICASSDGTSCGTDWNQGWIVWTDNDGNNTLAASEIVRYVQASSDLSLATASAAGTIKFDNRGRADTAQTFTLKPSNCPSGQTLQRELKVTSVGQVNMKKENCP